jgi:putative nucleotidyltransferase with HDIG domain
MTDATTQNSINKDEVLAKLHQLPMLSAVVQEVIASFKDSNLDRSTLAHKISQDQGLSAKILRVANSPFYGLSRKVGSIQDAALVMGFNGVRSLALSAGFVLAFPHSPDILFDRRKYWLYSFRVAGYTQALAKSLGMDPQIAFTVGMFHDIGQLVLDVCIPELFAEVLAQQQKSGLNLLEVEQAMLGFDHTLIGSEMAKRWNFPPEIEHAIRFWRTPEQEPFEKNTGIVFMATLLESGLRDGDLMNALPETLCNHLQLDWERIAADIPEHEILDLEAKRILDI